MSAHVVTLRAPRPRLLRGAVRRWLRFRSELSRRAALRRHRLMEDARLRFDERAWSHSRSDPRDDPRVHRWRPA